MDEWGIDGVVNLSGMYPGPPRNMLETQLAAAADQRRAHRRVHDAELQAGAHGQGLRRGDGRRADRGQAPRRARPQDHQGPRASAIPAPDGQHLLAVDDPGLDPLFERAGALGMPVAIHIGDPKAFWKPVIARERTLGRAARPPGMVVLRAPASRRGSSSTTRSNGWSRATRRRPSSASTSATTPRIRTTSRACSTSTRTSSSTRRRACPRSAATRRRRCGASSPSTRTACCSAPTPASAPTTPT